MSREWQVPYVSDLLQCEGRYGRKRDSASVVMCPTLLTDFNLTCTARDALAGNAMWHILVTRMQCKGKWAAKVLCPQE
jgi:hypothetical protein